MNILYFLIPAAFTLASFFLFAFLWAARNGQFDDLVTPAHRIFLDDYKKSENENQPRSGLKNTRFEAAKPEVRRRTPSYVAQAEGKASKEDGVLEIASNKSDSHKVTTTKENFGGENV